MPISTTSNYANVGPIRLTADVPNGGTLTIPYPTGTAQADYTGANAGSTFDNMVTIAHDTLVGADKVAFVYGATNITVTNTTGFTWSAAPRGVTLGPAPIHFGLPRANAPAILNTQKALLPGPAAAAETFVPASGGPVMDMRGRPMSALNGSGGGSSPGAPTLGALTLTPNTGTVGVAYTGTLSGATAGSSIAIDNMTVSGTGTTRTVTGTPSTAGTWSAIETLAGAVGSPRTSAGVFTVAAAGVVNLSGAQARVAITDASYFIGSTASTDTAYVSALKASSTNKTVPFPSVQQIPAGSIGYVILRIPATDANSPPIYINWDGAASQPSAASPMLPTVLVATDANTAQAPSPTNGTFVQDNSFVPFRPNASTAYVGTGQRYHIDTVAAGRDIMIRFDLTNASITQNVIPQVACSSGQWVIMCGNSLTRNQNTNISGVSAGRNAFIAANPGSDPFFFISARSGANQQAIIDEQVTPILATAALKKFVRGVYVNPWVNDIAYVSASVRPYSTATQAIRDGIRSRSDSIISSMKSLGVTVVAPDCNFLNFTSADATANATPYVNGDFQSPNGSYPYNTFVFGPAIKTALPSSWDNAYDLPYCSDYAGGAEKYETDMNSQAGDSVHFTAAGYNALRTRRAPLDRVLFGAAPSQNTLQARVVALGSTTTTALKTRLQSVFDATYAMYPTSDSTAQSNRTTLRAQLDAITAT